ncbi:hypothetical protein D3C87_1604560 [compost metagenome]
MGAIRALVEPVDAARQPQRQAVRHRHIHAHIEFAGAPQPALGLARGLPVDIGRQHLQPAAVVADGVAVLGHQRAEHGVGNLAQPGQPPPGVLFVGLGDFGMVLQQHAV